MRTVQTCVLYADIKGYSKLNDTGMKTFHSAVQSEAREIFKKIERRHYNEWGDGVIVACDDIVSLADAALKYRDFFVSFIWRRLQLLPLEPRISLHVGQCIEIESDLISRTIVGRTIVLAARIEPIVKPNRIWMTNSAKTVLEEAARGDDIDNFSYDYLGKFTLPKSYGEQDIFVLRRSSEAPISDQERKDSKDAIDGKSAVLSEQVGAALNAIHAEVVISLVIRNGEVLVVRRKSKDENLDWMFPSGKMIRVEREETVAVKEVFDETGVLCVPVRKVCEIEKHQVTGLRCHVHHLESIDDTQLGNRAPRENAQVEFVDIFDAIDRIGKNLSPDIETYLRGYASSCA